MQGIPYISAVDSGGDSETLCSLALHLLLVMIEYKPPSVDNLKYLIKGGHPSLLRIYNLYMMQSMSLIPAGSSQEEIRA